VPTPMNPTSNDMRLEDFTHDAVGNRLTGPDSIEQYTYDADNRLLSLQLSTPLTTVRLSLSRASTQFQYRKRGRSW